MISSCFLAVLLLAGISTLISLRVPCLLHMMLSSSRYMKQTHLIYVLRVIPFLLFRSFPHFSGKIRRLAVKNGDTAQVEELLKSATLEDISWQNPLEGNRSLLALASSLGNLDIVQSLLSRKASAVVGDNVC